MADSPFFDGINPEFIYSHLEICKKWRLDPRWIRDNWVRPKAVAHTKQGDLLLFLGEDIKRWVVENKTAAEPFNWNDEDDPPTSARKSK